MESIWLKPHRVFGDLREFLVVPRKPRRAQTDRCAGEPEARDHRDLAPSARATRPGAAVHERERPRGSRAREPVRHRAARRRRDWLRQHGGAGRPRPAARGAARAAAPAQHRRGMARAAAAQGDLEHGAAHGAQRGMPRGDRRGTRRGSLGLADPNLLARGRRAADHLGAHDDARPRSRAAEPRHLSSASDRPKSGHHALARAPRRRDGLPRVPGRSIQASVFR